MTYYNKYKIFQLNHEIQHFHMKQKLKEKKQQFTSRTSSLIKYKREIFIN